MIGIVVVGYNSKNYLTACFDSILGSNYKNYKIFFVDNGSVDNSIKYIYKKYKKVIIIKNKKNLGFAKANNIGAQKAVEFGSDYIFLLNPDTKIDKNCLTELVNKLNKKTILQPIILIDKNKQKTDLINTTGGKLHFLGFSYCSMYKENISKIHFQKEIPIASGAAMLIPKTIIQKIGLFDDDFFMYHEDVDFSWRARLAGFQIELVPRALVWHKYNFSRNARKMFLVERNRLLFILKNYLTQTLLFLLPLVIINEFFIIVFALKNRWCSKKLLSYISILPLIPKIIRQRKVIKKLRKKSDRELLYHFASRTISFSELRIPLLDKYNAFVRGYFQLVLPLLHK